MRRTTRSVWRRCGSPFTRLSTVARCPRFTATYGRLFGLDARATSKVNLPVKIGERTAMKRARKTPNEKKPKASEGYEIVTFCVFQALLRHSKHAAFRRVLFLVRETRAHVADIARLTWAMVDRAG